MAVATEDRVELMTVNGTVVGSAGTELRGLAALAYDIVHSHLFLVDNKHPNASIFRVQVFSDAKPRHLRPLVAKGGDILGVAYDVMDNRLYWTTGSLIMVADVMEGSGRMTVGSVLHKFQDESPHAIVVDACRRYLYWTNSNFSCPSIERSTLNGSGREVLVKEKLGMPVGLTLLHSEASIYWVHNVAHSFQLERAKLDGSNRELIVKADYYMPISLAAIPGKVFWTDLVHMAVWSMEVNAETLKAASLKNYNPEIKKVIEFQERPTGIVVRHRDAHVHDGVCKELVELIEKVPTEWAEDNNSCLNGGRRLPTGQCWCDRGFEGAHCENSVCHQYCLGEAKCRVVGAEGRPICDCPPNLMGERCQLDGNLCHLLCSFDSHAYNDMCRCDTVFIKDGQAPYTILNNTSSTVEEAAAVTSSENSTGSNDSYIKSWQVATLSLSGLCGLLMVATLLASYRVWSLRKRPRLKRRYKVNPSQHNLPPQADSTDHCEIAIENCCNMNICETPCCEPEFRTINGSSSRSRKEEKKGLLDNIETQPDSQLE